LIGIRTDEFGAKDHPFSTRPFWGDVMKQERKELLLYSLAVLVPTTLIVACFSLFHVANNWAANALMFVPGLMALVFWLVRRQGFKTVGWGMGPPIYWLWAILLPILLLGVSLSISIGLGYAAMAPTSSASGIAALPPLKLLINAVLYTVLSVPFAFGEEFGWRGYAQGKFVGEFGLFAGLPLLGLLWGFWHTPIFYFMDVFPKHPILGPFVMTPIDNILVVVPMAWLYIRSKSIWVPTLTHAFADVLWGFSSLLFPPSAEVHSWTVLQIVQLILSIVLLMDLKSKPATVVQASERC
jgi:membrane protease YdiL (CAAX protease family)